MNTFLKFVGGLALGAAIGAGVYLVVTKDDDDEGFIHNIKESINKAIDAGRLSAEERRQQLEQELGFSIDDEPLAAPPVAPQALPQQAPPVVQP